SYEPGSIPTDPDLRALLMHVQHSGPNETPLLWRTLYWGVLHKTIPQDSEACQAQATYPVEDFSGAHRSHKKRRGPVLYLEK
ncbi:MAG: hypothetical protein ACP5FH_12315, partial [Terracidiphilus sp.]